MEAGCQSISHRLSFLGLLRKVGGACSAAFQAHARGTVCSDVGVRTVDLLMAASSDVEAFQQTTRIGG
eukprot:928501-Alexandrium_andersonii.AAC.1